jgi:hypothetical protein
LGLSALLAFRRRGRPAASGAANLPNKEAKP